MTQEFTVYGVPAGKGRARVTTRGGYAHAYTPKKTKDYEAAVRQAYIDKYGNLLASDKPIHMEIDVIFEPPKSWSNKKKLGALTGEIKHTKKPDLSNVVKSVEDALNGIAYKDDAQIIFSSSDKGYGEENMVVVTIREVDDGKSS